MNLLTDHEIAILAEILHYEAINGSFIQKAQLVSAVQKKKFDPVSTAIKILELEKSKQLIKAVPIQYDCYGYALTNEGETYVIANPEKFEVEEVSLF